MKVDAMSKRTYLERASIELLPPLTLELGGDAYWIDQASGDIHHAQLMDDGSVPWHEAVKLDPSDPQHDALRQLLAWAEAQR